MNIAVTDILARYDTPQQIGGGGQKLVFAATDPEFGRVVVKVGGYRSPQALERARREVSVLASFSSRYYPKQFRFEVIDDARYVICEELLDGRPLEELLAGYTAELRLLPLARHLVVALSELWTRRIVHRDIKPANIIITPTGPKIIDLGIARLLDATSLTQSFAPRGPCTPVYASPEQLRNAKRDIDHRSDQFSLGIVLSQLVLGGGHPFDPQFVGGDEIPNNILQARWAKTPVGDRASPQLYSVLSRLLAIHPYMRYRTGNDLLLALAGVGEGGGR